MLFLFQRLKVKHLPKIEKKNIDVDYKVQHNVTFLSEQDTLKVCP